MSADEGSRRIEVLDELFGQSKVRQLNVAVDVDENVFGLEVPIKDV